MDNQPNYVNYVETNIPQEPNPVGRPTDYKQSFCARVIELGKQGYSITEMACDLDIVKNTLYVWEKIYPEFKDALTRARQESQAWYEVQGRKGLWEEGFNASTWAKQVSCRFPDDYRDTSNVNQTVNDLRTTLDLIDGQTAGLPPKKES